MIVLASTVAMFAAILTLSQMASTPGMTLLYAGMDSSAAGDVVTALEQRGVKYEVRGEAIYVQGDRRDELRMTLASEGLPANSAKGYELLDSLSGFGTTSQMFDAAYWRAKEGELARTILASSQIKTARVHIANTSSQVFRRDQTMTASVTVTGNGGAISPSHAKALRFLVASAVSGLAPEEVSVIDGQAGQVIGADDLGVTGQNADDKAEEMRKSVERIMAARVGAGNAVVEISVETVTDRESIVERTFDPESRVAISTETEERSTNSNESGSGGVSVASNLPEGDAAGGDSASSQNSETRERVNYEVSETQREVIKAAGAVKRVSVAVLVDGTTTTDANGAEVFTPRSEEEIAALRELVASAVGFDESRGDVITIKSMAFEPVAELGTEGASSALATLGINVMTIIQLAVLGLVAIVLGMFVVRPILTSRAEIALPDATAAAAIAAPPPPPEPTGPAPYELDTAPDVLTGEIQDDYPAPALGVVTDFDLPDGMGGMDDGGLPELNFSGFAGDDDDGAGDDPVARLKKMIDERQEETVATLKSWMEEEETA